MKKILMLFVFVIAFIVYNLQSVYSQLSIVHEEYLSYQYSDTAQYHKIITLTKTDSINWVNQNLELIAYDNQNRIVEDINKYWNNGTWVESYRNVYEYDTTSLLKVHKYYFWKNNDWILIRIDSIYFLNNGLINWEIIFDISNNKSTKIEHWYKKLNNNYIEEHNSLSNEIKIYNNFHLFFSMIPDRDSISYSFNNENKLAAIVCWDIFDPKIPNSWFDFSSINFLYDKFDSIIYEHYFCRILDIEYEESYSYDSLHRLIYVDYSVIYNFAGEHKEPTITTYAYDDSNRITYKSVIRYHNHGIDIYSVGDNIIYNNQTFCFPNPFSSTTNIKYTLDKAENVAIAIYNYSGQEIERINCGWQESGEHIYYYDASKLAPGFYYYMLKTGSKTYVNKMEIMR